MTYPEGTHPAQVFAFLRKHGEWLERKLGELHLGAQPPALEPGVTTVIPLRGESTRLVWRVGTYPRIEQNADRLVLTLPSPHKRALDAERLVHLRAAARVDQHEIETVCHRGVPAYEEVQRARPLSRSHSCRIFSASSVG